MNNRGFSLIELLIVISIIGILSAIAVTGYVGVTKKAARSEAYSNLNSLRLLEEQFFAENACYQPLVAGVCPAAGNFPNTAAIQGFLPGFRPGASLSFTYAINNANGIGLPAAVAVPYNGATAPLPNAATPCFIAIATGIAGSRVEGDVFAIDCNNITNF